MQSTNAFTLLLDMDAMFDTRMGTLLELCPEIHQHLPLRDYRHRTIDDWSALTKGIVTTDAFVERYNRRDIFVLKRSLISGVVPILMTYVDSLKERFMRGVDVSAISIDINTYPYVIPGPVVETIQNCLRGLLPAYVSVNVCHLTTGELKPDFIGTHYNGWITYDLHTWLEYHQEALLGHPVNGLAAIAPRLFKREPGSYANGEEDFFKDVDKHGLLEMVMEDFLHIEHIPVSDFCFILPGSYSIPVDDDDQPSDSASSDRARSASSTEVTKSS